MEKIVLDWNAVPEHIKQDIARSAYHAFTEFMKRPDAEEILERERELLIQEGSTLLEPRA